jgi:nitroreductase
MQDILDTIIERHSTRAPFDPGRAVAKPDLERILEAARWAPTAHNMQNFDIVVVDDPKLLKKIAGLKSPISRAFVRENYPLLSFSEEELSGRKVGILGSGFPRTWLTPKARRTGDTGAKTVPRLGRFIDEGGILLVMTYDPAWRAPASGHDFLGAMSLGCVLENLWLEATALGLSVHVVSSVANKHVEGKVKGILGIPPKLKIALSVRLGYALPGRFPAVRVRRDIGDFVHYNGFVEKGKGR